MLVSHHELTTKHKHNRRSWKHCCLYLPQVMCCCKASPRAVAPALNCPVAAMLCVLRASSRWSQSQAEGSERHPVWAFVGASVHSVLPTTLARASLAS